MGNPRPHLPTGRLDRGPALAIATAVLVALVLAIAGSGVALAKPARPRAPEESAAARTIRFRVVNATTTELQVDSYKLLESGMRWRQTPQNTRFLGIDDYNVEGSGSTRAEVYYKIGDSPYEAYVYAANPLAGFNSDRCVITLANHTSVPADAPYTCDSNAGSGNDMNATFVVQPRAAGTQTLTPTSGLFGDELSQLDAVQSLCLPDTPPAFVSCDVASPSDVKNVTTVASPERIVSQILVNCTSSPVDKTIAYTNTVTETNTIGVTAESTYKMSDNLTPKLAANYQHQWQHTLTTTDTTKVTAQPGEYVYLAQAVWMQQVTATWTLKAGNQTFLATDLTLLRPSVNNSDYPNVAVARSFRVPTDFCVGKSNGPFFQTKPAVPAAGGGYTIRPANANGRSIAVNGASHEAATPLALAATSRTDRSQRWFFYQLRGYPDYFQIRSGNTTSMCLELNGIDSRTIQQYPCKAETDSTIGNQLWKIVYNPITNSPEMVSMAVPNPTVPSRTLALENSSFDPGVPVIGLANPAGDVSGWTFYDL